MCKIQSLYNNGLYALLAHMGSQINKRVRHIENKSSNFVTVYSFHFWSFEFGGGKVNKVHVYIVISVVVKGPWLVSRMSRWSHARRAIVVHTLWRVWIYVNAFLNNYSSIARCRLKQGCCLSAHRTDLWSENCSTVWCPRIGSPHTDTGQLDQ